MNFDELHALIPYAKGGKAKSLSMQPYNGVTLLLPGRHADESKGGDFCVCVDDDKLDWTKHQFTHSDIFKDIEDKHTSGCSEDFIWAYYNVVKHGADPNTYTFTRKGYNGLHPQTFLFAVQCLSVAEHRRYARYEAQWGGRFLPARYAFGIAQGLWTAADASNLQRRGRPGVEQLERQKGMPNLTEELMK